MPEIGVTIKELQKREVLTISFSSGSPDEHICCEAVAGLR